jgi:hypothetical protein
MSKPLLKKQIAAQAGISPRTMRRNWARWKWIEGCRSKVSRRPMYNSEKVQRGLSRRGIA